MLLVVAADRRPGNRIYNLGYSQAATNFEMFEMIAAAAGWQGKLVVENDGSTEGANLIQNWVADTSKFRSDFDYTERFTIEQAFKLAVEHALRNGTADHD